MRPWEGGGGRQDSGIDSRVWCGNIEVWQQTAIKHAGVASSTVLTFTANRFHGRIRTGAAV